MLLIELLVSDTSHIPRNDVSNHLGLHVYMYTYLYVHIYLSITSHAYTISVSWLPRGQNIIMSCSRFCTLSQACTNYHQLDLQAVLNGQMPWWRMARQPNFRRGCNQGVPLLTPPPPLYAATGTTILVYPLDWKDQSRRIQPKPPAQRHRSVAPQAPETLAFSARIMTGMRVGVRSCSYACMYSSMVDAQRSSRRR